MRLLAALTLGLGACGSGATADPEPVPAPAAPSVYDLEVALVDQGGAPAGLDAGRGHPTIVSMFYTSCPAACPMLIARIQALEAALPEERRADLRVVLVSVDPARDTPEALARVVADHDLDERWRLLTGDELAVRKVAAVLGFEYRRRSDGDFDHSSTLVVLDGDGVVLGTADAAGGTEELLRLLAARGE